MDEEDVAAERQPPSGETGGGLDRLSVYTYLTVPDRGVYLAIMRGVTATLLADLSAHDVAERLAEQGMDLPVETVAARLASLEGWGALLASSRPVRATSIREYQRARSRYQLTTLGERLQRQADERPFPARPHLPGRGLPRAARAAPQAGGGGGRTPAGRRRGVARRPEPG